MSAVFGRRLRQPVFALAAVVSGPLQQLTAGAKHTPDGHGLAQGRRVTDIPRRSGWRALIILHTSGRASLTTCSS